MTPEWIATNEASELWISSLTVTNPIAFSVPPDPHLHLIWTAFFVAGFVAGAFFAWFWLTKGKWRLT